jgi:hypothetical protein
MVQKIVLLLGFLEDTPFKTYSRSSTNNFLQRGENHKISSSLKTLTNGLTSLKLTRQAPESLKQH